MCEYSSQDITELAKALIAVQQQLHPAFKDSDNPFTKSRYASLNSVMQSCRDALIQNGIWLTQYPVPAEPGCLGLVTKLTHAESGQWQSSLAVVPLPKADPQGVGISMTYMRRYALSAMLAIVTEEDTDGEWHETSASARQNSARSAKKPATAPQGQNVSFQRVSQADKNSTTLKRTPEPLKNPAQQENLSSQRIPCSGNTSTTAQGSESPENSAGSKQLSNSSQHPSSQRKATTAQPTTSPQAKDFANLPQLAGISYELVDAQDGQRCILATGETIPHKDQLAASGFRWNPRRKIWWKYAV